MLLKIYPENINERHIKQCIECLENDGIIVFPTDTVYALGCNLYSKTATEKLARIKGVKLEKANFSIICNDLSNISEYTKQIDNRVFKVMRKALPGPFTFILNANGNVPKIFKNNKKTIGIRIPNNAIPLELVRLLGNPILTTSVHDDDEILEYTTDPELIHERYENDVDIVIDGGFGNIEASTIVDCTNDEIEVVREGIGNIEEYL